MKIDMTQEEVDDILADIDDFRETPASYREPGDEGALALDLLERLLARTTIMEEIDAWEG